MVSRRKYIFMSGRNQILITTDYIYKNRQVYYQHCVPKSLNGCLKDFISNHVMYKSSNMTQAHNHASA